MGNWLNITVGKADLFVRMLFAATLWLLPVHSFAQTPQFDDPPNPTGLNLSRIVSIPRSAWDWLQDSFRSPGERQLSARPGACENGLGPDCAFIDTWWFGDRPNEHYEGEFHDGALNGHGIYSWSDGRRYEGEFRDSKFNGHGVFTWPNGNSYEGEWSDSKPNGVGKLTTAKNTFNGIWTEGCFRRGRKWITVGRDSSPCPGFTVTDGSKRVRGGAAVAGESQAQSQLSMLIACVAVERKTDAACVPR
jgi:hypothetical protein